MRIVRRMIAAACCLVGLAVTAGVFGQDDPLLGPPFGAPPWQTADGGQKVVSVAARFTAPSTGQPARLYLTATIQPGWHIYSITQRPGGPVPTKINLHPSQAFRPPQQWDVSPPPQRKREKAFGNLEVESHLGTVTWSGPIELAPGVDPNTLKISGSLRAQPCDASSCLPPQEFSFAATLGTGIESPERFDPKALVVEESQQVRSLWLGLGMGFLGGLILNLMPCVFPVIGLKILAFVEQAGHSRRQALMLNLWYSLGLLAVFVVFATLAVLFGFGWGEWLTYKGFNITLAAVVFAMGLSFLGVWEIPIPGFVGRGKTLELGQREGASGAIAKGVLTTVLATPCTAPFLAPALTWAAAQPPLDAFAVFIAAGLGMASPYLVIGAFPELLRFLPRPGAWMETFQQIMGFVLMGTVVFILTFIPASHVVPTVALLFGLWAACWWIGRGSPTADLGAKARRWLAATAFVGLVWLIAFQLLLRPSLPWQPFTQSAFDAAVQQQKTVLVDFTADWCLTCKTLEAGVLNTRKVRELVDANGVLTLKADWTNGDPEVTQLLELLGSKQVPVIAIFPAGNPNRPIVLRGGYVQQTVLDALQKAGPSKAS